MGNVHGRKLKFCRENFCGLLAGVAAKRCHAPNSMEIPFADCSLVSLPKDTMPPIPWRYLLQIATRPQNLWKVSPSKVSRCIVSGLAPRPFPLRGKGLVTTEHPLFVPSQPSWVLNKWTCLYDVTLFHWLVRNRAADSAQPRKRSMATRHFSLWECRIWAWDW